MGNFDFQQLQSALANVNNAAGVISGGASLLATAQQNALQMVSTLAQSYQQLQAELEEKTAKVAELEAIVAAEKKEA